MENQLLLACLSAVAFGAQGLFAQAAAPAVAAAPSVSVTATASVVSQYMFRGQRLSSAAFQPAVEIAAGDYTGGVWASVPFDGKTVPDSSDPEIDLYGSYTLKLSEAASIVPGVTSYHYPKAPTSAGFYRWTFEPNVAVNYTVEGLKFTPKLYYDTVLKGATYELTAAYAIPMKDIGSELGFTATAGTYKLKDFANDTNPSVKAWGDYWLLGVAAPFQINKQAKLTVGFAYTEGKNAFTKQGRFGQTPNSLAIGRGVVTVSYAWSF
ncbi:MAG: hypothetical protein EXS37_06945 [Opitutus sp.]|nr:hypothetical protein [Opitutus sp.]